jgi:hypothetical protein
MQADCLLPGAAAPQTTHSTLQTPNLGSASAFKHKHSQQIVWRQLDGRSRIL